MSVYEGLYTEYELKYSGSGAVTEDAAGGPSEAGAPKTVRAWFETTTSPKIMELVGADETTAAVEGGLLGVESWPEDLVTGSPVEVTVSGRKYELTLIVRPPSAFALIDELEGPRFWGKLRGPF